MLFERDTWREILETMRNNRLRTFLTAFSVAWGIFILVVLLGTGNGLRNGAQSQFANDAANSIWIDGGFTNMAYRGLKTGRKIQLTNADYYLVRDKISEIDYGTAVSNGWGNKMMSYQNNRAGYTFRSVMPDHFILEKAKIISGRFINQNDIDQTRKVCCIGYPVRDNLFGKADPIGKYIDIEGMKYQVIGIFSDPGRGDNDRVYVPITTAQKALNWKTNVNTMWMSTGDASLEKSEEMAQQIRTILAGVHQFDPNDLDALGVYNNNVEYKRIMGLLDGISLFISIIGVFTLIAGIVGVSNIMMITVKERTREIGIRKAIGATPVGIVWMIMQESIFITALAGYIGLVSGVGLIELVKSVGIDSDFFKNPDVDFGIAIKSTVLLIIAGALAGLIPSLRAARIQPVTALRAD